MIDKWKCVFVYEENWESDHTETPMILLQQYDNEKGFGDEETEAPTVCDYSRYEHVIDIESGYGLMHCVNKSKVGTPIHLNSPHISPDASDLLGVTLVIDLFVQNPMDRPIDSQYISVCGDVGRDECLGADWGFSNSIHELSLEESDLAEFCTATGQSLKKLHIMCTESILAYMHR